MGASFLSGQLFRRDCCSPVRAERSRRSCQCSEEALGVLRQRTGLPSSELPNRSITVEVCSLAARFSRTTRAYLQNRPYPRSMRSKGYIGNTKPRTLTEHNVAGEIKRHGICDFPIDKIAALAGVCRTTVQTTMHESARLGHIRITPRPRPGRKSLTNIVEIISTEWKTWIKRGPSPARQIGSNPAKIASPTKNIDFKTKGAFRKEGGGVSTGRRSDIATDDTDP